MASGVSLTEGEAEAVGGELLPSGKQEAVLHGGSGEVALGT